MRKSVLYVDGHYLTVDTKMLDIFTPGVFQGKGVFETLLAIGNQVFDVPAHLKRLKGGFKGKLKITAQVIQEIVKRNGHAISRVRVVAWRENGKQHIALMALKYTFPESKEFKVCLIKTDRQANSRLAQVKSLDYKVFADAYQQAKQKGFDEALLINNKGNIFEASRSNVFWVSGGKLFTPPLSSGCLNGITRIKIIKQAKALGIKCIEKNTTPTNLKSAEKIFLTNSLIGLQPAVIKR